MTISPSPELLAVFGEFAESRAANGHDVGPFDDGAPPALPEDYPYCSPDDGRTVDPETGSKTKNRFAPIAIDDVEPSAEPAWLIDRLLPARGLACIVGPPKSGKSFLASDALFAAARGRPYAGRATLKGPVFYATGEGVSGFKRRMVALRRHHCVEGKHVPFFMIENVPDLGSEKTDLQAFLDELARFIKAGALANPRVIALDTVARCMGDGDENTARDMGRLVTRCGLIERKFGCLVLLVHHTGKDPTRKGRGSNALNGAVDATWEVEKTDGTNKVTISEMKDGPEGEEWTFRLEPYALDDGSNTPKSATLGEASATGTCVVEILSFPTAPQQAATPRNSRPLPTGPKMLIGILREAITEAGEVNAGAPSGLKSVTRPTLKTYAQAKGYIEDGKSDAHNRALLSRDLKRLSVAGLIGMTRDCVWMVSK